MVVTRPATHPAGKGAARHVYRTEYPPLAGQQLEEAMRRFVFEDGPAPHGVIDVDELLTDEQLAAWQALCDGSKRGPFHLAYSLEGIDFATDDDRTLSGTYDQATWDYLVAAANNFPLLLAEVRRLRVVEAEFRQWVPYLPLTPKCLE